MLAYFTTILRLPGSTDWSGHTYGRNVHFSGFWGRTRVKIGLNLKGVNIFLEFPVSSCSASVWLSILIPKSMLWKHYNRIRRSICEYWTTITREHGRVQSLSIQLEVNLCSWKKTVLCKSESAMLLNWAKRIWTICSENFQKAS